MSTASIPIDVRNHLIENGFVHRRGRFFRERDSIVQCVVFERPSQIIYPTYCIIPLYMPCTTLYYTYGRRISEVSRYRDAPTVDSSALIDALDSVVLPLFERLKTPALLSQYLLNNLNSSVHYLFCPSIDLAVLEAYTALFLAERELFSRAVSKVFRLLDETTVFTHDFTERTQAELETLIARAKLPDDELRCFFEEIIAASRKIIIK